MEENIADALKIAGSVLLFVIGLSVAFLAFSQARETIDSIVKYSDREYFTIENDARFYYLANNGSTKRIVGVETIIPAIYRAYKENYKIVFETNDNDFYLFLNEESKKVKKIDPKSNPIGEDKDIRLFLNGILYRKYEGIEDYNNNGKKEDDYEKKFNIKFNTNSSEGLYDYLKDKKIEESLGTYYQDDLGFTPEPEAVQEVDKTEKRVITYTF